MRRIVWEISLLIENLEFSYIVGVPTAGDDFARGLSKVTGKPLIVFDNNARHISGAFSTGKKVLLVENVTTTGDSAIIFARRLQDKGIKVSDVLVLVDRGQGAISNISCEMQPHVLLRLNELLEIYLDEGLVSQEQHDEIIG